MVAKRTPVRLSEIYDCHIEFCYDRVFVHQRYVDALAVLCVYLLQRSI
jgi:hypothetical protein